MDVYDAPMDTGAGVPEGPPLRPSPGPGSARVLRRGALILLAGVAGALMLTEGALQVAALFTAGRAGSSEGLAPHRILCVGDSHTYGAGLPPGDSYPARLQAILDQRAPRTYSVINLGVPGMNTAQVRHRLSQYAGLYQPQTILIWVGVNDAWNRAELDPRDAGWRDRLDGFLTRSRLYRLVRVRLHDRRLERDIQAPGKDRAPSLELDRSRLLDPDAPLLLNRGGRRERIEPQRGPLRAETIRREAARRDFEAMAGFARSAGIRILFLTYPIDSGAFHTANAAARAAALHSGIDVIETGPSVARVPQRDRVYIWALHPSAPMYREIARDVADLLVAPPGAGSTRTHPPAGGVPQASRAVPPARSPAARVPRTSAPR